MQRNDMTGLFLFNTWAAGWKINCKKQGKEHRAGRYLDDPMVPNQGQLCLPGNILAMSGWVATCIKRVEVREAAEYPTMPDAQVSPFFQYHWPQMSTMLSVQNSEMTCHRRQSGLRRQR